MNLSLSEVCHVTAAEHKGDMSALFATSVAIDSRNVEEGGLFIAFKGEHADGHDYIHAAANNGAVAALVEKFTDDSLPQIKVDACEKAMVALAKFARARFEKPVLALTGSSGKTTTKEMIGAALSHSYKINMTHGNLNNELGVPLTVISWDLNADFSIVEMGAAQLGDIAYLCDIASPDVALITNIGEAHIGRFGGRENIYKAKSEIYEGLVSDGVAVVNIDDQYASRWQERFSDKKLVTFSISQTEADVFCTKVVLAEDKSDLCVSYAGKEYALVLRAPGEHNVHNALAALACCVALDVPMSDAVDGLATYQSVSARLEVKTGVGGCHLIDDTYNANPSSVIAAAKTMALFSGKKIFVLGSMAELGEFSAGLHEKVGRALSQSGVDAVYAYGEFAADVVNGFGASAKAFSNKESIVQSVQALGLKKDDVVLVKGSRSAAMEDVVKGLEAGEETECY